jgi:carbamoyltransferase
MKILGISSGFHDAAATLLDGSDIVFASHSERYSKNKHDADLHPSLVKEIAKHGKPDVISYYETPWVKKTRQLYTGQWRQLFNFEASNLNKHLASMSGDPSWSKIPVVYQNHHTSHAAAGFQTSPFNAATVVVIDAIGEWDTISIWSAKYVDGKAQYKKIWNRRYPHSIGLMYSAFTDHVGLMPMDEEYILMGMAAYGTPNEYRTADIESNLLAGNLKFKENLHIGLPEIATLSEDKYNVAYDAQVIAEKLIRQVMLIACELDTTGNLVYQGGVALNCLANRFLGEYFENIWIMPNPGDAGSSLGAAALVHGCRINWTSAYLGHNIPGPYPVADIINELLTESIVGVASGRAEFGPRALGNRSLLADPRGQEIKGKVNAIKRRQQFRPFAPVILEELADAYFDMPRGWSDSRYMQSVARCRHPDLFPAIIHHDGTSRVQTVPKDGSGIRQLLEQWYEISGCPMLLNTSLNIRGEPMVNDRADADRFETLYGVKVCS